jgi:hypothetical protein
LQSFYFVTNLVGEVEFPIILFEFQEAAVYFVVANALTDSPVFPDLPSCIDLNALENFPPFSSMLALPIPERSVAEPTAIIGTSLTPTERPPPRPWSSVPQSIKLPYRRIAC